METVTVEILHNKAYRLLEDLADLDVIRLHRGGEALNQQVTPEFGFASRMITRIDDDFNEPLTEFSEYMP